MNPWHGFNSERIRSERLNAVAEIPKDRKKKYELDNETELIRMDPIRFTFTRRPMNYGFATGNPADDGDPLDVLVIYSEIPEPLSEADYYPIGLLRMIGKVSHFFDVHKTLEHSRTSDPETCSREETLKIINNSIARYSDVYRLQDETH